MKRLYVCEWNPNGTNDLLVVEDGEIKDRLPEALSGVNVRRDHRIEKQSYALEDFIAVLSDEENQEMQCPLVQEISVASALRRIAVSPVTDGQEAIDFIKAVAND